MSPGLSGRWDFEAIGTRWQIATATALPDGLRADVSAAIDAFDRRWSRFRDDSDIRRLATGGGAMPGSADATAMLDLYADLAEATDGAVDPLIGDALAQLGYGAHDGLVDRGPAAADWRGILHWSRDGVVLDEAATIDVGACGKGRLVDLIADLVCAVTGGPVVVDGSGDLAMRRHSERIALEHPYDPSRAIGVWRVTDAALCASATNRRAWGDGLHHVLDARTGEPVRTIAATWAVADSAMLADGAATALFFDGGAEFAHAHGVAWVRMTTAGGVEWSPGCTAELFTGR